MDEYWEPYQWTFDGPLLEAADLPTLLLYGVVLTFIHAGGPGFAQEFASKVASILGAGKIRRGLLGTKISFPGPPAAEATLGRAKVKLKFRQRVKPNRLKPLLRVLGTLPGASRARIDARTRRFAEPGSRGGAPIGD